MSLEPPPAVPRTAPPGYRKREYFTRNPIAWVGAGLLMLSALFGGLGAGLISLPAGLALIAVGAALLPLGAGLLAAGLRRGARRVAAFVRGTAVLGTVTGVVEPTADAHEQTRTRIVEFEFLGPRGSKIEGKAMSEHPAIRELYRESQPIYVLYLEEHPETSVPFPPLP